MYNEKELELFEFNKKEIGILIKNKISKTYINELKKELFKHGLSYEGAYKEFLYELEKELLQDLISIKTESYFYSSDIVNNTNQIEDLITVSVINKDEFYKEFEIVRSEQNEELYCAYYQKSLVALANNNNFYKYYYRGLSDEAKNYILMNFDLDFLEKTENEVMSEYGNNLDFKLAKPILNKNKPLFLLQKQSKYSDGMQGYECYELCYNLIIVTN